MEGKVYPDITVVDEKDTVIGYMQLFDAIDEGLIRRVSCILICNEKGEILLQRRAAHVLSPNVLDYSAAGHVDKGDSYEEAARRELKEELHLSDVKLELIIPAFLLPELKFFTAVYRATLSSDILIIPNREEVAEVFWVPFEEFKKDIENNPHNFAASFVEAWQHLRDKISL